MKKKDRITPIKFCLLWHQHQPYYRAGSRFLLPWAWLHATKDYLEMAQHFERHPNMRGTINLVPSLLKQIEEYLAGDADDPVIALMTKPAEHLTKEDRETMIGNFFMAHPDTLIFRSKRYRELYDKVFADGHEQPDRAARLNEGDYRDLAVHYSLAWTGEIARRTEPFVTLIQKDRDYTEEDKQTLWNAQRANVRKIIPLHRALAEREQIELTTTPFYHPILPLLIDTRSARDAMPAVSLPLRTFAAPEEADRQLRKSRTYFETEIGMKPRGLWPSEGSVSAEALALIRKNHFHWTATDEGVLMNSLGTQPPFKGAWQTPAVNGVSIKPEHSKFFPWKFETPDGPISIFFRDHRLSDNIGFVYQSWNAEDAARDFTNHLLHIRTVLLELYGEETLANACISVILDGENCWEYYPNNGFDFLDKLYSSLTDIPEIAPVTFSEALGSIGEEKLPVLPKLIAGSWINANFRIWIGHPEDNAAWDAVAVAKVALERARQRAARLNGNARREAFEAIEKAEEELMIAEGSDWCWWFGDDHYSPQKATFDALFRLHLRAMYAQLDLRVPDELLIPIPSRPDLSTLYQRATARSAEPPTVAGKLLNESWSEIPNCAPVKKSGSMHRSEDFRLQELQIAHVRKEILLRMIFEPS
ncbi:MAG TPA: glycoside hydrolase family 57 protein, partial [Candidatus Kapabacteria bacterium]|nr:glycoside hydrolase family 57 protein [Candidatus Kapabacteria bacterium]